MDEATQPGSVVMITGAAGNLGRTAVQELSSCGWRLVCVEHNSAALDNLVGSLPSNVEVLPIGGADLADFSSCEDAVGKAIERFGRLDALVNTVGGFRTGPVDEAGMTQWEQLFHMNAKTAYAISAAALKPMIKAGYGRIVHVAAAPGLKAGANQAAYAASKGAVIRLTEAIAAEHRSNRITANCILPGTIDTPQNRASMPNAKTDGWVQPSDIAKLLGFLVSPEAGIVTGAAIPATGRI